MPFNWHYYNLFWGVLRMYSCAVMISKWKDTAFMPITLSQGECIKCLKKGVVQVLWLFTGGKDLLLGTGSKRKHLEGLLQSGRIQMCRWL